jgi:transcriptional regulator with XRE-family HTH domain
MPDLESDIEHRVEATEYLSALLAKWIDDDVLDDAAATILAELMTDLKDAERRVRELALDLLTTSGVRRSNLNIRQWVGGATPRKPSQSSKEEEAGRLAGAVDEAIGARLKAVRVLRDMPQAKLAEGAGMTFQQVQKYEHGQSRMAVSTLIKFASVLNIPPGALLPAGSRRDDPFNGLADVLAERGVIQLLRQIADLPEERRGEVVRALRKLV